VSVEKSMENWNGTEPAEKIDVKDQIDEDEYKSDFDSPNKSNR